MSPPAISGIDPRGPRFNQGVTGTLALLAYLLDAVALVPFLAVVLGAGALLGPRWSLWNQLFVRVVKPTFRLGPPAKLKEAAPVRFALVVGALFLAGASAALFAGLPLVGWGLTLVVAALALLAAVTDVCVGCEMYVLGLRVLGRASPRG